MQCDLVHSFSSEGLHGLLGGLACWSKINAEFRAAQLEHHASAELFVQT
jgi:hypothetical protein